LKTRKLLLGCVVYSVLLFIINYFFFNEEDKESLIKVAVQSVFSGILFFGMFYWMNRNNKT